MEDVVGRLGAVETSVTKLDVRLGAVETSVTKLDVRVGAVETSVTKLDARLGAVESAVAEIRALVASIAAVLPHLATKADVKELRVEIAGLRSEFYAREALQLKWLIGTLIASVALACTIAKLVA